MVDTRIVRVKLDIPKGLQLDAGPGLRLVMNNVVRAGVSEMGSGIVKLMKRVLSPGHAFNVGASGRAAHNIYFTEKSATSTGPEFEVFEGDYPANPIIRQGRRPGTPPTSLANRKRLIDWMIDKGIAGQMVAKNRFFKMTKKGGRKANRGAPRPFRQELDRVAYAMAIAIGRRRGSERYKRLPPVGQPRFDYVRYAVDNNSAVRTAEKKIELEGGQAIIEYMLSGHAKSRFEGVHYPRGVGRFG